MHLEEPEDNYKIELNSKMVLFCVYLNSLQVRRVSLITKLRGKKNIQISSSRKMSPVKLIYFNVTALGEPIRYLLSYGGVEFEDERHTLESFQPLKDSELSRLICTTY